MIYQGRAPALLALDGLDGFSAAMARAHATANELVTALEASGKVARRAVPNASNIYLLEMPRALAEAAFERGRTAGVRIGPWKDGVVPLYVNQTILRRPASDYVGLFLG